MSDLGPVSPGHAADAAWLRRWRLRPDGDPMVTASGVLIPVRTRDGDAAMLKIAHTEEEERGVGLLTALDGHGAAKVLRHDRDAVLLERATGPRSLVRMVRHGRDDQATRIICDAAGRIHEASHRVFGAASLIDLRTWFRLLFEHADDLTATHRRGADAAVQLLEHPQEPVALHGDLHHGNVLDFGERGWLAIDPKGLVGEAGFDYANLLCNPSHRRALHPGRLERQFGVVVEAAGLERRRLARWLEAWCALSSTWFWLDGDEPHASSAAAIGERARRLG